MSLDQPVDREGEQLRGLMLLAVPVHVVRRALEAKIRSEINDLDASFEHRGNQRLAVAVR